MTISPINIGVNGTVVNCFEGTRLTESVASTTVIIIDPDKLGKNALECYGSYRDWISIHAWIGDRGVNEHIYNLTLLVRFTRKQIIIAIKLWYT